MQIVRGLTPISSQPFYLRFNRYIRYGYRPLSNSTLCIKSLLYLHNESVNVYSHAFAFIYFFSRIFQPDLPLDTTASVLLFFLFWQGSCLPFLLSVIYHLFMCHSSGVTTYNTLLRFDIIGVYWMTGFGIISSIYLPLIYFPNLAITCITIHLFLTSYFLWRTLFSADTKAQRIYGLAIQWGYRIVFHLLRLFSWSGGHPNAIWYLILAEIIFAAGAYANASNFPEKSLPISGKIIYFINSHTLMHYASVAGVYICLQQLIDDLNWMHSTML